MVAVQWRAGVDNELVFALANGSVHRALTVKSSTSELYAHPQCSPAVSMACLWPEGPSAACPGVVVGHADGTIYRYMFDRAAGVADGAAAVAKHSCAPGALVATSDSFLAGGIDLKVTQYSIQGRAVASVDLSDQDGLQAFMCAAMHPSGDTALFGAFNAYVVLEFSPTERRWRLRSVSSVANAYSITALAWAPSGSHLALGTLSGSLALYAASLRRARYAAPGSSVVYDLTWLSRSQIEISAPHATFKITARSERPITKVDIYRDQFVVAFTRASLLMGNLTSFKLAEIDWAPTGSERFHFENDRVAMVVCAGEVTVIEYDQNTPLATFRSEHLSPYLTSCAVGQHRVRGAIRDVAAIAYLIDAQTVKVLDAHTNTGPQVCPLLLSRTCLILQLHEPAHWIRMACMHL